MEKLRVTIMKQKLLFLFISIFILSVACTNQKAKKTSSEPKAEKSTEVVLDVKPRLHSISDIKAVFQMADVGYFPEIINPPANALNYTGDRKIAANMGVYLGDMLYVVATSKKKIAYLNYGAIMELAKNAGLTEEFPQLIIERYEKENLSTDSMLTILDKALDKSEKKLTENDKAEFFSFILLGNYIEKLYIVSKILVQPSEAGLPANVDAMLKRNLFLLVAKQTGPLEELISIVSKYAGGANQVVDMAELNELLSYYKEAQANKETLAKLAPSELYKSKEVVQVFNQIEKVRNRIVD